MEVFEGWNLGILVGDLIGIFIKVALGIFAISFLIKFVYELYRGLLVDGFRLGITNFIQILVIAVAIGSYDELWPKIGDAFYLMSEEIRGESETAFRNTAAWEAINEKVGIPEGESRSTLELIRDWGGTLWGTATGWLQNLWSLAFSLSMQPLAWMLRGLMVAFKNIVYAFMLIVGPIPLVLSLIPGLGGLATHWVKNFIVVSFWNVTIAILDVVLKGLNVALIADMFNGDEELSIAMLTMLTAVMYLMVPYLTSLVIGQTVVAMAGQKMIMQPLTTAAILGRLAAGIPSVPSGASGAKPAAAMTTNAPSNGAAQKSGLITMGSTNAKPVRTAYTSSPSRSGQTASPEKEYFATATPVQSSSGNLNPGSTPTRQSNYRREPRYITSTPALPPASSSETLSSDQKAKYQLGPKKEK
ncbi:hypothetical protein [Tunicatimonas pelagia]|uniref:hypothetical protein n=1 Tax=Tunicatimonas pelagia TaxID=931531 RepID=UPI0026667286|nr:hypothetical protein [Tunicatimonas pelagia]WKN46477.1 hypothetical protein P0M28_30470 [Tunicatimonas pelagia]